VREDIEIVIELRPNLGFVRVDPAQIEQVILNLAINAADAMPAGGRLTIETAGVGLDHISAPSPDAGMVGPHVMMVVTDTGMGIDDKDLPHVFEPFYTTKAAGEGTGLGLATVYGIVKQSGGHLFAASTVGVGTTFRLYFPQVEHGTTAEVPDDRDDASTEGIETILLVEDDETVRRLAARALRDAGYNVLVAGAPAEALQLAESIGGAVDLLLTDLVMPGMSGTALAAQMVARFSRIRVLYASGYAQGAAVSHGALEPGVDFLAKPFIPSTLRAAVRRVLDRL
jgi:CheY-like chemotaxis protein